MTDYEDLEDLIEDLRMCQKHTFGHDPDHCDGCTHDMNGCWEGLMKDAADAIEELQKPKWISVEERLPENDHTVLVWGHHISRVCFDICDHGRWIIFMQEDITHWMPLPEPPKEETDG